MLKFHLPDHVVDDLKRFGRILSRSARPFEHFNVLIKKYYRMTCRRLSTKMHETVQNLKNALDNVQRLGTDVHRSAVGVFALREKSA